MKQENKDFLALILEKKAINADTKTQIKRIAYEEGFTIETDTTNTRCKDCWLDAAAELLAKGRETEDGNGEHYALKDGVDVWFGSVRVNKWTLTDNLAHQILAKGFDRRMFATIPESDED